jgi:ribosomal protein S18 acetylase RimI-like enzyme
VGEKWRARETYAVPIFYPQFFTRRFLFWMNEMPDLLILTPSHKKRGWPFGRGARQMSLVITPGRPEDCSVAAAMIADTDRDLFMFFGGGDLSLWVEVSEWEWREPQGIYSHTMSHVARRDGIVVGLLISYAFSQLEKIDWSFGSSRPHMTMDRWSRVAAAYPLASFLFPAIPQGAYYVQNIVTHPSVRGSELRVGKRLMELAFENGRAAGCRSCHLDVDSSTPAVGFYERLGLRVLVKTEVLGIPGVHTHYRMVCDL